VRSRATSPTRTWGCPKTSNGECCPTCPWRMPTSAPRSNAAR
jgi:hypothetical protein